MRINIKQAKELVALFGEDEETVLNIQAAKTDKDGHSGPGIYVGYDEYPEEGSHFADTLRAI